MRLQVAHPIICPPNHTSYGISNTHGQSIAGKAVTHIIGIQKNQLNTPQGVNCMTEQVTQIVDTMMPGNPIIQPNMRGLEKQTKQFKSQQLLKQPKTQ
jgi:hypothetical protein